MQRPTHFQGLKKERRCMLIDTAAPSESNTSAKFTEKLSKYKDFKLKSVGCGK